ncbi:MAG: hypothetical protein LBV79_12535 [Candidatus Adiutrix sp.]|jgi:ApbE superfamily uncharacterized protein (UPF0280 family)|nr:hypothetical protein [Candidatus Adiutrix sp.]
MAGELAQLDDRTILAQYGPMRLTIQAWGRAGVDTALAAEAGRFSFSLLPRLAPAKELFRRDAGDFGDLAPNYAEPLLNHMVLAVHKSGHKDLGPLAAVAGVVADAALDFLCAAGAVKAIVENGGDVAIHLDPGQEASVGVRLGLQKPEPACKIVLSGDRRARWGVCSSGLGGRGLTRGVADTALCVAETCAVADAMATALGNEVWVDSPVIKRVAAEVLRPDTDIRGLLVTESAAELSREEIGSALSRGLAYAQGLVDRGALLGGLVSLRGQILTTANFERQVAALEPLGS